VSGARVLIIEEDEWTSALLVRFLREAGYVVEVAREARAGLERARRAIPDCVICDAVLPDIDGFWVIRRLRTEHGPLGQVPLAFLTPGEDSAVRMQALKMGADVTIAKPFRNEEVVAQVAALLAMATRHRRKRDSMLEIPPSTRLGGGAVFRGDLAQFSVATALALLEMERRTGVLKVTGPAAHGEIVFEVLDGALVRVTSNGKGVDPIATIRESMGWSEGRFAYESTPVAPGALRQGIGGLLLEAMRLEDEANR
jgi:two-component system OmpR family response regulator